MKINVVALPDLQASRTKYVEFEVVKSRDTRDTLVNIVSSSGIAMAPLPPLPSCFVFNFKATPDSISLRNDSFGFWAMSRLDIDPVQVLVIRGLFICIIGWDEKAEALSIQCNERSSDAIARRMATDVVCNLTVNMMLSA
jgi:hypothetical protein